MVSPSKIQRQPQHQNNISPNKRVKTDLTTPTSSRSPTSNAVAANKPQFKLCKGPKPLDKKIFYLDIKNQALSTKFENKIKELGGVIELFLVKNISIVVTDRTDRLRQGSCKWGYTSGGSGGPPSLRSIDVQTPTPTPPTPYRSVEGPLSNSTNQRGSTTHRPKSRVEAMLERALTQPQQCSVDPLNNAYTWGIPVWSTYELQNWLDKITTVLLKDTNNIKRDIRTASAKEVKTKQFKAPFIKFESYSRQTRPIFVELQTWPTIKFDGEPGSCPYSLNNNKEKKQNVVANKNIKENKEKHFNPNTSKGKDMTRRPRATSARARKTENTGYCEICRADYRNLSKHLQSDQHKNFISDKKNFISLDNLINTGASVEAFLKINRQKDGKGSILSSREHSLDNGIQSGNEKTEKRNKFNVNDFDIDDVKMVQCNGARRNLNSKLDTSHNLRTRAKHESGHSLRSKGKAEEEQEKSEKSSERYTIAKRAKGILWIEEEDSEDDKDTEKEHVDFNGRPLCDQLSNPEIKKRLDSQNCSSENVSMNGDVNSVCKRKENSKSALKESFLDSLKPLKTNLNGYDKRDRKLNDILHGAENKSKEIKIKQEIIDTHEVNERLISYDNEDTNSLKSLGKEDRGLNKLRRSKPLRGRQRLSVEERLIEDNRDYYKVEVLGNKLRSSAIPPGSNILISSTQEQTDRSPKKDDKSSPHKTIGVRFKRVRKSELTLLSDEAETFMFGEPRHDSSSESDGEQTSILPKDTESDAEMADSQSIESSEKREMNEDDLSNESAAARARKRRRTHTEVLLKDNSDYYKFETPGSRLRFQAPLTGVCDLTEPTEPNAETVAQKVFPSKPSPEVENMHFSFEAIPKSESWYQTYQRQDDGEEFYYYSEIDRKPFLLPYEIENFHEILLRSMQSSSIHRKRGGLRGRGRGNVGSRSPRKSPRCHASTLAIMSTIIKRREQTSNLPPIEEDKVSNTKSKPAPVDTAKSEKKTSEKSDVDEDLKEIVKNIDEMLSTDDDIDDLNAFEGYLLKNADEIIEPEIEPPGPPINLIELLDNCHDTHQNGVEGSSCASSECGENSDCPKRRKKKRKNKTGWPGNKMRRKLHIKNLTEELQKELDKSQAKTLEETTKTEIVEPAEEDSSLASQDEVETENETGKENEQVLNKIVSRKKKGRRPKSRESKECNENADETESKSAVKSITPNCKVEEEENESRDGKEPKPLKETLSSITEDSEESLSNNENFCTQERNSPEKPSPVKFVRKRKNTTSSEASQSTEAENSSSRRQSSVGLTPKKRKESSEGRELQREKVDSSLSNNSSSPRKGQRRLLKIHRLNNSPNNIMKTPPSRFNKSKESFLAAKESRALKKVKRNFSVSSELLNGDIDAARASPAALSDVDQRRSSIDFQPVVKVVKIDERDIDSNSVISVSVASNRRLRSSSSPRSSLQPPNKRSKTHHKKRHWIKNS